MKLPLIRARWNAHHAAPAAARIEPIQRLENRLLFAHLGHQVFLPEAAANGANGLETAIDAPADHRRSRLISVST